MRRGTYSIVARDPATGELGVAVQSHWFSVGSIVTWAQPGVGAVATQSIAEPAYGPRALERLRAGEDAAGALAALVAADPEGAVRQVAVVDAGGGVACHTGPDCIPFAGDAGGAGYSCQANMMASADVWPAMAAAFEAAPSETPLAERLLAALEAGERAGGDVRGRQSAALLVVPAEGEAWHRTELRVEDHPEPLDELGRLLRLHRAYEVANDADELAGEGRLDEAGVLYERSSELAPESDELLFWAGLAMAHAGDLDAGVEKVRRAIARNSGWAELLPRLSPELAPGVEAVRGALGG
jgi:uncharacterized Ntn-hydrolase superfamily protein